MENSSSPNSADAEPLRYTIIATPLGDMGLAGTRAGLARIVLNVESEGNLLAFLQKTFHKKPGKDSSFFVDAAQQFHRYFSGQLKDFSCKLDLSTGTPFQQSIWKRLQKIPYGRTQSYKQLADAVGKPNAYRAAGSANGKNPLPIIIPCHRVIRENGDLGGYTGGLHIKRFLLDLERSQHGIVQDTSHRSPQHQLV